MRRACPLAARAQHMPFACVCDATRERATLIIFTRCALMLPRRYANDATRDAAPLFAAPARTRRFVASAA